MFKTIVSDTKILNLNNFNIELAFISSRTNTVEYNLLNDNNYPIQTIRFKFKNDFFSKLDEGDYSLIKNAINTQIVNLFSKDFVDIEEVQNNINNNIDKIIKLYQKGQLLKDENNQLKEGQKVLISENNISFVNEYNITMDAFFENKFNYKIYNNKGSLVNEIKINLKPEFIKKIKPEHYGTLMKIITKTIGEKIAEKNIISLNDLKNYINNNIEYLYKSYMKNKLNLKIK